MSTFNFMAMIMAILFFAGGFGVEATLYAYTYTGYGSYCAGPNWCINRLSGGGSLIYGIFDSGSIPGEATMAQSYVNTLSLVSPSGSVYSGSTFINDINFNRLAASSSGYDVTLQTSVNGDQIKFYGLINQVVNPFISSVGGSSSNGARVTISGNYLAGSNGYYPPGTYVTVGGVAATIVSISKTSIVIDTPALSGYGAKTLLVVYPTITLTSSITYSAPSFATPVRVSGSSFPFAGGSLTVYGANFGLHSSSWTLVNGGTVIAASSVGRIDATQASSWVVFAIPSSTSYPNQGDWTVTYSMGSIASVVVPINYLPWLSGPTEYTENYYWTTTLAGPWASGNNPSVAYLIYRRGYTVTVMGYFSSATAIFTSNVAQVSSTSNFPSRFRPFDTIRCTNHVVSGGVGRNPNADYSSSGQIFYNYEDHTGSPTIYPGVCTYNLNK